jgi:hypothetical protein
MDLIKNCCAFIFLLAFAMTAVAEDDDSQPYNYKLSCAVYDRAGAKTTLTGSLIVFRANVKPFTEGLLSFTTDSNKLLTVTDAKVKLAEDGSFNVDVESTDSESRGGSRLSYDFKWQLGGSYVVVRMTSCLQCAALRQSIVGTGLCSLHQELIDEP